MIRVDPLDLQVLVKKTVRMYQGSQEEFTRREIRNLPFVISSSELSMPVAKFALRQVDLDKNELFFGGCFLLIFVTMSPKNVRRNGYVPCFGNKCREMTGG